MENLNLENSIKIFAIADGVYNFSDIKKIYRTLAHKNHPDRAGGSTEIMQLVNTAYEDFCRFFETNEKLEINQHLEKDNFINFEFISELKIMQGVIIEVCGYWIWLRGDTFPHKDKIQALGFVFSGAKKSWYWSPTLNKNKRRRGSKSMKAIRKQYGSMVVYPETVARIN